MLTSLLYIIFWAFAVASFSNFLDDCFDDGNILDFWGRFVDGKDWAKPLGGCLICMNTWVAIIAGGCIFWAYPLTTGIITPALVVIIKTVVLIAISNTFLKFIIR